MTSAMTTVQQIVTLQQVWQGATTGLTPANVQPLASAPSSPASTGDAIQQLQTLWNQPTASGATGLNTASAGPTPSASDAATTALIDKLKQGADGN